MFSHGGQKKSATVIVYDRIGMVIICLSKEALQEKCLQFVKLNEKNTL